MEKREKAREVIKDMKKEYNEGWDCITFTEGAREYCVLAEDTEGFKRWLKEYQGYAMRVNSLHRQMAEKFKELTDGGELTGMKTFYWVPEDALRAYYENSPEPDREYELARAEMLAREYLHSPNLSRKVRKPQELVETTAASYKASLGEARSAQSKGIPTEYVKEIQYLGDPHLQMFGVSAAALERNDLSVAAEAFSLAERINPDVAATIVERCKTELQKKGIDQHRTFRVLYGESKKKWNALYS